MSAFNYLNGGERRGCPAIRKKYAAIQQGGSVVVLLNRESPFEYCFCILSNSTTFNSFCTVFFFTAKMTIYRPVCPRKSRIIIVIDFLTEFTPITITIIDKNHGDFLSIDYGNRLPNRIQSITGHRLPYSGIVQSF